MQAALQHIGLRGDLFEGYGLRFVRNDGDWVFGLCLTYAALGFAALALGPVHLQVEWPI
jgi:hypothetical protein